MRELLYPIFLRCCASATSDFWHEIFEDLAYGKTPHDVYISNGYLCCKKREREFSYRIPAVPRAVAGSPVTSSLSTPSTPSDLLLTPPAVESDPEHLPKGGPAPSETEYLAQKVYHDVSALLIRLKPIYENDRNQKKIEAWVASKQQEFRKSTWDSLRKKSTKDRLIEEYVLAFKNRHGLSFTVARALLSLLMLALIFKMVLNEDIQYANFSVQAIQGLGYDRARGPFFTRAVYGVKKRPGELAERRSMSENWKKFKKTGRA